MFLCRQWLPYIANDFMASLGLKDAENVSVRASQSALAILRLAPWHMRLAVGGVEIIASFWCLAAGILFLGKADTTQVIGCFQLIPVISKPLLRLYRGLVAVCVFEQPEVLNFLDIELPELRQKRYREGVV